MEQSIKSVVKSIILSDKDHVDEYTHAVEDLILNNTKAETPFAIKSIYRESLLKQWKENLGYLEKKIQHLEITGLVPATRECLWLIKVIGQDRSLFTNIMEGFNNNTQLCQLLLEVKSEDGKPYSPLIVEIIIYFLKALGSAETITTKDVKLKFMENWVPIFSFLVYNVSEGTKIISPWAYSDLVIRVMATLGGKDVAELLRKWRNQPAPPLLEGLQHLLSMWQWRISVAGNSLLHLLIKHTKAHLDTFTLLYYCHQGIPFPFQGVEEALSIVKVCAVWISDECLKACMRYLEAILWSFTEKIQIRDTISIIPCKVLEDLDARLVQSDTDTQDFIFSMEQSIKSVVKSIILSDEDHVDEYTHGVEDLILNNTKVETPFAIKSIYMESLLK
ncbi:hypothetical protein KI387_000651 [Taxus chinensis]|uniref:Uncharacterized protein n=1 Tax=Taxus chinensis TaxID=29808 RepID=A0AA38GUR8_TAXCH|nr:hypothetical protein KI387_000651 [Taxus chinensis]